MSLLAGIRVLEISDALVEFGGRMLAEMGAEVISLADPRPRPKGREIAWHHGKRRVLAGDADIPALRELVRGADIVIEGRVHGARFDLEAMIAESTGVIHVIARPFSTDGPQAGAPATDLTLMAQSGLMTVIGDADKPPLRFPGEQAYALTGIQAATAALMALHSRRRTGEGQRVEVSALQSATLANYREAIMYEWTGRIGRRTGNRLVRGKSGVRQVWPCADGFVTWSMIDNPAMMRAVVGVMEAQGAAGELAEVDWDAILVADMDQAVIDRWQAIVGEFFARHSREQLGRWSLEKGWGLSVINNPEEVQANAHLASRGLFVDVADPATGRDTRLPGPLFGHDADGPAPARRLEAPMPLAEFSGWRPR